MNHLIHNSHIHISHDLIEVLNQIFEFCNLTANKYTFGIRIDFLKKVIDVSSLLMKIYLEANRIIRIAYKEVNSTFLNILHYSF